MRKALAAAVALGFVFAGVAWAHVAVNDPNTIACPSAPDGWKALPVRKTIATPQSVPEAAAEEHMATGGNLVTVSCTYYASPVRQVTARVSYALPTDINPVNDFYWGCGTGDQPWDTSYRVYRVPSSSQWALGMFDDIAGYMPDNQAPKFESVAKELLQNANGYAHPCKNATTPTALTSRFSFDIYVAGANIKSMFWTDDAKAKNGVAPITQSDQTTSPFQVPLGGKTVPLTIELVKGIDFKSSTAHTNDTVRYAVKVVSTKVPQCSRGATGTLTISSRPFVSLNVCGRSFLQSQTPRRIRFFW